jgi:lysylphosphatidylglycerol synthetase-like protein (DUF2156 family)
VALLCAVLSLGRIYWWLEAPWIGVASAASIVLILAGLAIEHNRTNPMLMTRWLGSGAMIRLALAAINIDDYSHTKWLKTISTPCKDRRKKGP